MGLLFDKYIPQEWLNSIYSDIQNCDIEIRPSREWYNSPLFFLKKRGGLETKTGRKTGYKPRGWEYEKIPFENYVASDSPDFFTTGLRIKPTKNIILSKVKKSEICNADSCRIINSKGETIWEKEFSWVEAFFDTLLKEGEKYDIIAYNKNNEKFTSAMQKTIKFPIKVWKNFELISWLDWGEKIEISAWNESGLRRYTYYTWGIVCKAKENIMLTKIKKAVGSWASICKIKLYNEDKKEWEDAASLNYSDNEIIVPKAIYIKKGQKFWIGNVSNGGLWYYNEFQNAYVNYNSNEVEVIGAVKEWTPYDSENPDASNYYRNRYEIAGIEFKKTLQEVWDVGYNITEIAASETEEINLKQYHWETIWEIVDSKMFDDKMWMYTKKWYIYNFDWEKLNIVDTEKQNISKLQTGKTFELNNEDPKNILRIWNSFQFEKSCVMTSLQVRMRSVWKLSPSSFVRCHIVKDSNKKDVIATSETIYEYNSFDKEFKNFSFKFNNFEGSAAEKLFFYIEVYFTNKDWFIEIDWGKQNTYDWFSSKQYNSKTEEWQSVEWMIGFHIWSTLPMYVDQKNFDEGILLVDYLGGGIYPSDTAEYTVSSYDEAKQIITIQENTLDDKFIGKYAYIKSGSDAKYQERAVSLITNKNQISTPAGWTNSPKPWDKLIFYKKMEQQIRIPQIRKGKSDEDKKYIFTYTRNGDVAWRLMAQKRNIVLWDNRIVQLTEDYQALIMSSNIDYEIPILNAVSFGNSKATNIAAYGGYLIVFFKNKIGLVKKDIVNQETWEFAYSYQDLLDVGVYSRESFLIQGGNLYVFADDKRLYSVDLTTVSLWEIIGKLNDEGATLINYFDKFDGGTVKMHFQSGVLYLVYRSKEWWSEVFKYYDAFKSRIQDKYRYSWNFFNFLYTLKQGRYIPSWNKIYKMSWVNDDGKPIEQRIKIYGPVQWIYDLFTLIMCKVRLGLSEFWLWGKITITIWWYKPFKKTRNISELEIVKEINEVVDRDGTLGTGIVGNTIYGWDEGGFWKLGELFSEIIDISVKVGKRGSYFTIELENQTDRQLIAGGIIPYYNTDNPLTTYNKWVLK